MEGCLLCLEKGNESVGCIKVNSTQWNEFNIKGVIEQHLWDMRIQLSSWLCTICWQELYDFHKFYTRIEEAQNGIGPIMKIEFSNDFKPQDFTQNPVLPEFVNEEQTIIVKDEHVEDLWEDDTPLIQKISKLKRHATTNSIKETRKTPRKRKRTNTTKIKTIKKELPKNDNAPTENLTDHSALEINATLSNEVSNSHSDKELTPTSANNSSIKNSKIISQEKDEFIAENFKIICSICETPMKTFRKLCMHFKQEHEQPCYVVCCNKKFFRREFLLDHIHQHLDPNYIKSNQCGDDSSSDEDKNILFDKDVLNETPLEQEILLDQLVKEDNTAELGNDNIVKISQDPLKNNKQSKQHTTTNSVKETIRTPRNRKKTNTTKIKIRKKELAKSDTSPTEILTDHSALEINEKLYNEVSNYHSDKEFSPTSAGNCTKNSKVINQEKNEFIAENLKLICSICETPMKTFRKLCMHFKQEHEKPWYVVCCNKKFFRREFLLDHLHHHLDPNYLKCNQCGKTLSTYKVLKSHELLHLSKKENNLTCNECGKNFRNNVSLSSHIKIKHMKEYVKICDLCGKSLADNDKFQRHMLEHEGKPVPTVACTICGRRYIDKSSISRHMRSKHAPKKNEFDCHICSKKLASKDNLNKHIKYVHDGSNAYKCTICEKSFSRPKALKDHLSRHTGNPSYSCPWCSRKFYSNGNMHNHRKEAHPKKWEDAQREKFSGNSPPK